MKNRCSYSLAWLGQRLIRIVLHRFIQYRTKGYEVAAAATLYDHPNPHLRIYNFDAFSPQTLCHLIRLPTSVLVQSVFVPARTASEFLLHRIGRYVEEHTNGVARGWACLDPSLEGGSNRQYNHTLPSGASMTLYWQKHHSSLAYLLLQHDQGCCYDQYAV